MMNYQVVSYDQASELFPELRLGYESNFLQLRKKNKTQTEETGNTNEQGSLWWDDQPTQEELGDEWLFNDHEIPIPISRLSIPNIKEDEPEEKEENGEKEQITSTEFRNRSDHFLTIRPADEDLETMKQIETMEEVEEQDLLPIKVKGNNIILPNRIYLFLKDVKIVFITHFHHDDYNSDHYSTKFYFITDHCEIIDFEIIKKKKNFEITMTFISQKSFVIDFLKDDPSGFQAIRNRKEFGAMKSENTKQPHESYLRYFCQVFENQIKQFDEMGKFSLENGIHMSNLTEELLPQTASFMNRTYLNEVQQALDQKDQEIERLKKEISQIKTHIQYMPDGEMFLETQKHFDSLKPKNL
jgi:hypothetical protein